MVAPDVERMDWVLLVHRVPREPAAPRIAIWRRLGALGVGQLADGGGTALLLRAHALVRDDEGVTARRMPEARAAEHDDQAARARALATAPDSAAVAAVDDAAATVVGARPARTPIDRVGHPA